MSFVLFQGVSGRPYSALRSPQDQGCVFEFGGEPARGQALDEEPAITLGFEPRVEDRQDSTVVCRSDKPTQPLLERDDGFGYRVFVERIPAFLLYMFLACSNYGVGWHGKGKL